MSQALYVSQVTDVRFYHKHTITHFRYLCAGCHFDALPLFCIPKPLYHTLWAIDMPALWVSFFHFVFVYLLACRDFGVFCNLNVRHLKHELYLEAFLCSLCEA